VSATGDSLFSTNGFPTSEDELLTSETEMLKSETEMLKSTIGRLMPENESPTPDILLKDHTQTSADISLLFEK
jgi:hypothetical protein